MSALRCLVAVTVLTFGASTIADDHGSGFLGDYSKLKQVEDPWLEYLYTTDNLHDEINAAQAIIIDQPEIFIAADSKYKGMSPDEMKILADTFRSVMQDAFVEKYQLAASPGANTLQMRSAITNVHLKKKGRSILGYTPVGLVVGTAKASVARRVYGQDSAYGGCLGVGDHQYADRRGGGTGHRRAWRQHKKEGIL